MKLDRLIGILTVLLSVEKTTAPELARRFEVSRRTILRDIDALCRAGIPVVTSRGGDGGISIMEGYKINKSVLTRREMQTLAAGLKSVGSVSGGSGLENLMDKLYPNGGSAALPEDSMIIDLSNHHRDSLTEKIELLRSAAAERAAVRFEYYYSKGETEREIEPYFVQFIWGEWYVFGWCRLREDFRRFKLNRLWNPRLTDSSFTPRPVPDEQLSGEFAFKETNNVKILFDKSVRFRLIEDYGLNCYEETEDGLIFSMDYDNAENMFSWALAFGDKAVVIGPEETRLEIIRRAENIVERYKLM